MKFKAEKQIQKEINSIGKRWGLKQYAFAFLIEEGKFFNVADASDMFLDHLGLSYLGKSIENHRMKKSE
jgi:hypothetical protein